MSKGTKGQRRIVLDLGLGSNRIFGPKRFRLGLITVRACWVSAWVLPGIGFKCRVSRGRGVQPGIREEVHSKRLTPGTWRGGRREPGGEARLPKSLQGCNQLGRQRRRPGSLWRSAKDGTSSWPSSIAEGGLNLGFAAGCGCGLWPAFSAKSKLMGRLMGEWA